MNLEIEKKIGVTLENPDYLKLFELTVDKFPPINSLVDLGCGVGALSVQAQKKGIEVKAYDLLKRNVPNVNVIQKDFTKLQRLPKADMYASIEVFEHIKEKDLDRFMSKCKADYFLFSSTSTENDYGIDDEVWGHITLKSQEEWIAKFNEWGYELHQEWDVPTKWTKLFKRC